MFNFCSITSLSAVSVHIRNSPSQNTESSIIIANRLLDLAVCIIFNMFNISFRFPFTGIDRSIFSASEMEMLKLQKCVMLARPNIGTCL
ncbi:hypothetical protein pCPXV0080 [Cowpox virus]|uniref:Uncharacterized protein n=3 Tax=Orthopoxvirus TaxID=10242 RepID=A0A212PU35_COWPX|nr:unknown [Vaccinia virus Tian Tan]AGJ91349.1 hypothetical protein VACV_TT8_199 [Vaccinia virus]SNB48995.1 hypothetical protein pCPXV0080 [Cowpox virus]AGJ91621.1 hypothetical protein VACV_TT9_199 [Vaccinia virus]AGJ91891.1 hypothetical protein VACV_TT10_199 [Vaccinia virus]